jgi:hypothetical protein
MFEGITGITPSEQGRRALWGFDAWENTLTCHDSLSRDFRGINATDRFQIKIGHT